MLQKKNGIIFDNFKLEEGAVELTGTALTNYNKEILRNNLINSRLQYLKNTDWYITREIDEPNSYPQAIKDKRILARQEINEIETATDLSNYTLEF